MRLLPNIMKFYEHKSEVKSYDYALDFTQEQKKTEDQNEPDEEQKEPKQEDTEEIKKEKEQKKKIEQMLLEANEKVNEMLKKAEQDAERMKQEAFEEGKKNGYELGKKEGYEQAYEEHKKEMDAVYHKFLNELESIIKEAGEKKIQVLHKYKTDLKNIAIAVGEKVIQISLKSSGSVIERMIISATEKLKTKEWAKIYIAKCDADLMIEGDLDILRAITHLSDHLKVIAMENESPGTCIIELPDEIIDASANTQVENIKGILNSAGL